ncbi:MAG TPA: MFS transporter [Actinomycetota bacterium]|nr:MFS transporter [Actinomycetota bacterium]
MGRWGSSWWPWPPTSRWSWSAGASPSCCSTPCWPPWRRCCRTKVPPAQRGLVSGFLGVCVPIASVSGTFLVQLFTGNRLAMFLGPCVIGGCFILVFAASLHDRRLAKADRPAWSLRELAGSFYVNPRQNPDFAWAFVSRFLFVLAYAFLVTYQVYYLLEQLGSAEAEVPRQVFLGTLVQSTIVVTASLAGGRLSDRTGRRKLFVLTAAVVYGLALFVLAIASGVNGFLVGMAVGGLGFGVYTAVDLALVVDVLPDTDNAAKDLGVLNIAGASRWRRGSPRPSWPWATAATGCSMGSLGSRPSWSCRHRAREGRPVGRRVHQVAHHMW